MKSIKNGERKNDKGKMNVKEKVGWKGRKEVRDGGKGKAKWRKKEGEEK